MVLISDKEAHDLSLGKPIPYSDSSDSLCLVKSQCGFLELVSIYDCHMFPKKLIRKLGGKDVE